MEYSQPPYRPALLTLKGRRLMLTPANPSFPVLASVEEYPLTSAAPDFSILSRWACGLAALAADSVD
jgi:hypothetical protein